MNDAIEPMTGEQASSQRPAGIWEHYCSHAGCTKWGGLGYQEDGQARWYCSDHKHVAEARRR